MKKISMYFITVIIIIVIVYSAILFTDFMRFKNGNIPVFAMCIKTDITEEGYENRYIGFGYKLNEKQTKKPYKYNKIITLFGKVIYNYNEIE